MSTSQENQPRTELLQSIKEGIRLRAKLEATLGQLIILLEARTVIKNPIHNPILIVPTFICGSTAGLEIVTW